MRSFHINDLPSLLQYKTFCYVRSPVYLGNREYGLDVRLIPQSNQTDCPTKDIYRERFSSCSCGSYCSWDLCRTNAPPTDCPIKTIYRERFSSCSCGSYCSWDLCRTKVAPTECLVGTRSVWKWDKLKNAWVAQIVNGIISYLKVFSIFQFQIRGHCTER